MPEKVVNQSTPLKISMKDELEKDLKSEYLLIGLTKIRPLISADEMRILLRPNQGAKGKMLWLKLMKSGNENIIDALSDIFTGMGLDPDEFTQGDA